MKRLVLAIILITSTVIAGFASLVLIENINSKMYLNLDEVTQYAKEENYPSLNTAIVKMTDEWEKQKPVLNVLIGQQGTNEITTNLRMIEYFAKEGNKESVLLYVYECKADLEKIKITNEPSLSTIF